MDSSVIQQFIGPILYQIRLEDGKCYQLIVVSLVSLLIPVLTTLCAHCHTHLVWRLSLQVLLKCLLYEFQLKTFCCKNIYNTLLVLFMILG